MVVLVHAISLQLYEAQQGHPLPEVLSSEGGTEECRSLEPITFQLKTSFHIMICQARTKTLLWLRSGFQSPKTSLANCYTCR